MSNTSNASFPPQIGNYVLGQALGSGVSGSTFLATHVYTGQVVALKVQPTNISYPTNSHERMIYPMLQGGVGMPKLWASGIWGGWDYLAMDLLGNSLDRLYRKSGKGVMDMRSVCSIAIQLIERLECMHSRGVLHRDVQLGNCVVGLEPRHETIYMIDFGFAKRYLDHNTRKHIANRTERCFIGNYWFSSVNVHCRGKTCSRRDDLESAALLLLHLLTPGGLPWTRNGVPRDDAAHDRLKREKRAALPEDLARGLPEEFEAFLRYCRSLGFTQQPDYAQWRERFRDLAHDLGFTDIDRFVWPPPPVASHPASRPSKAQPMVRADTQMEGVLLRLANMNINRENAGRPVLGDRKNLNVQDGGRTGPLMLKKPDVADVIVVSDSEQSPEEHGPAHRYNKAARITKLTLAAGQAVDNRVLAQIAADFVKVLQSSSSRTLTREGFAFLDALHKQLADPSVFIVPLRSVRSRTSRSQQEGAPAPLQERRSRLNVLRGSLAKAQDNKTLARLVAEFGTLVDKAAGRKLTNDGLAFLEGMAERLLVVRV
ncbi:CK1/CK1 protein kinase [Gloeopeniophorella convolvens]|nr:CK1/CK1 protein kinase [Gloeopeniophorella convolvens]